MPRGDMKFRKGKVYEALFLSDVHYLLNKKIKLHSHRELFQMLDRLIKRRVRFNNIYLVGDIIESWYFSASVQFRKSKKRFDKLFDRLDAVAARPDRKFYIVGNHDTTAFSMELAPEIARYLRERNWAIGEKVETPEMIVVHGHQGQYTRFNWMLSILVVRALHALARIKPSLFQTAEDFYDRHLNRENPRTAAEKLEYYRRLSKRVNQGKRLMISGHTHGFLCLPELNIINTGDWVGSRTFVVQRRKRRGDRFTGLRMMGRKTYRKEFVYRRRPIISSDGRHEDPTPRIS